ncbi:DUF4011 domain-containing protein [Nocardia sp. AG03]|uniref:DUF4011 domain-containing protein n=1 Tax=Nocardia sp. AG03 TaxID=3025312 RepID=UPI0024188C6A|nr:DUF4011 domain-containing protein [Nocardia sp. AG03]
MTHTRLWEDSTAADGSLTVQVSAQPAINLALVHNSVPLISGIYVTNSSGSAAIDVTVTVRLHGNGAELAPQWVRTYDGGLAAGAEAHWDDFAGFAPSVGYLRDLNESHPATLSVTVTRMWGQELHLALPVKVLAHNEWFNAPAFYDSLAAFVQPNTAAVQSVLSGAADLLRSHTGDASISGYQGGQERAAAIAMAIYESLRARGIGYITPPASFEATGQKIRTSAQVLQQRLGTCIDLAVTYAACLEAAGLRPLVWLLDDHAFAGFLSGETTLPSPSLTERNALVNLVESGSVVPVEAVYYDGSANGSFTNAIARARQHFSTPEKLAGTVGITAARKSGVLPLPSWDDLEPGDSSQESATSPIDLELPDELRSRQETGEVLDPTDTAPARVRAWKRALLDLSLRNRLLNLKPSAQVIDLHIPRDGLAVLDDLIHDGAALTLVPHDDLSSIQQLRGARSAADLDPELLRTRLADDRQIFAAVTRESAVRRLKGLAKAARTLREETGSANLYLTLGALIHRAPNGTETRAPLFLLPVRIIGGAGRKPFQIVADSTEVATPNRCLVEWLRLKHHVTIDALEAPQLDDSGLDMTAVLRGIRKALVDYELDLRIDEVATLAICQFSTFGIWKDLAESWDTVERSALVRHLTHHVGESFRDPHADGPFGLDEVDVDEADVVVPIPADGSQLRAIALAAAGRTFVLEGPPGTGKSQTITNLIAHALGLGKTVLFVAEKQAALEVVRKRLDKVGLRDFTLDLHGKNQSPKAIRDQLKAAIDNSSHYNERSWQLRLTEFRDRLAPLADYPGKVHDRNAIDQSLWSAYEEYLEIGQGHVGDIPLSYVTRPPVGWEEVKRCLELFSRSARQLEVRQGVAWSLTGIIPPYTDAGQILAVLRRTADAMRGACADDRVRRVLESLDDPEHISVLQPAARRQIGRPVPDDDALAWMRGPQFEARRRELFDEIGRLRQGCAAILAVFTPMFLESGDAERFIAEAEDSGKGVFGKKKRAEQFQQNLAPFARTGADLTPEAVLPLLRAIPQVRGELARTKHHAAHLLGYWLPLRWNPLADASADELQTVIEYIAATVGFVDRHPAEWCLLESVDFLPDNGIQLLEDVQRGWHDLRECLGTTDSDLARWRDGDHWVVAWERTQHELVEDAEHFGAGRILGWSQMSSSLNPLRDAGLDGLIEQLLTGAIPAAEATAAFVRGTAQRSIEERRRLNGLDSFLSDLRDGEIDDFVRTAVGLRDEQVKALPAELLRRRPFQANALSGEIGELRGQLERTRAGASFRQLMLRYADQILAATPCVFVSPASLAQFIPPGSATFDIVVFDEASQVPVAQAIGALGRGRSAVIVGDSQQMPPTSFGQVTTVGDDSDEDDETTAPEDLESILTECVESGVPRLWLSWHYRSQDESLIRFSNQEYYEGKLASLPSPGGDVTAGVEWRRVPGHFNREKRQGLRTNRVEAEAVVEEIRRRLATPHLAGQSIGVVTFNIQQRDLVQDLLESSDDPLVLEQLQPDAEEGIFVKNLENVQGDERDVILFTAAFSAKPGESQLPLNFGPLSRTGGEKRFNVAITRARRKVIVFTSFDPSDIDLSRTTSTGMKHLRGYLEMAAGHPGDSAKAQTDSSVDPIQRDLCSELRRRGFEVETNYGLSEFVLDVVVREPGCDHWQVAILLDGPKWRARPTVTDRDLTPRLLETMMHWGCSVRVWLPEWIDAPEVVLDRIEAAVDAARRRRRLLDEQLESAVAARATEIEQAKVVPAAEDAAPTSAAHSAIVTEPDEPALLANAAPVHITETEIASATPSTPEAVPRDWHGKATAYHEAPTSRLGSKDDLERTNSPSIRHIVTEAVRVTVETEGPIELDRLAQSIGRRFGYDRVPAVRKDLIIDCVPTELVHKCSLGTFVWPHQIDRQAWRGFRANPVSLSGIAPEEIINALVAGCGARQLDEETLMREALAAFGKTKLSGPSRQRLEACIDRAVQNGRLIRIDSLLRAGS